MATLRDIRRRITGVQKTQQITRAMRMVAAAKLRRAQDAIVSARPYANRLRETLAELVRSQQDAEHPLLTGREAVKRVELVVVTSDRGLCGAFNANVIKHAERLIREREAQGCEISITAVGRKGLEHAHRHRHDELAESYVQLGNVDYAHSKRIGERLVRRYEDAEVDEVILVYGSFVSALTQSPRDVSLLPVVSEREDREGEAPVPYDVEPDTEKLLAILVPRAIEFEIFRALLENQASEHAARMTAMESATRNTEELIDSLTLQYNRARQASITKELVEIVTGAEALHG